MSDGHDAIFPFQLSSPGQVRAKRLAEAAGVSLDSLRAPTLHRLARALESGFRTPAHEIFAGLDRSERWRTALDEMPKRWWFVEGDLEIVVTGFGPFQDNAVNPSKPFAQAVAAGVAQRLASSYEALEVTYRAVEEFVDLQDYESQPLLVHCGLAESREAICLERYAHNLRGTKPDNTGETVDESWVVPGGPTALETFLPLEQIVDTLGEHLSTEGGIEATTSQDAGVYVCNALYYRSLMSVRQVRLADRAAESIFVHVPTFDTDTARRYGRVFGEQLGRFLESALSDQLQPRT